MRRTGCVVNVFLSDAAKADLREIALLIARDNRVRAKSFVRALREKALDIGKRPHAFPLVARYARHGIRRRGFGAYLIFYWTEDDAVTILRILHGARDYEALLFPDD